MQLLKGHVMPAPPIPAILGEPITDAEVMNFHIEVSNIPDAISTSISEKVWERAEKFAEDKGYTDLETTFLSEGDTSGSVFFHFQASR